MVPTSAAPPCHDQLASLAAAVAWVYCGSERCIAESPMARDPLASPALCASDRRPGKWATRTKLSLVKPKMVQDNGTKACQRPLISRAPTNDLPLLAHHTSGHRTGSARGAGRGARRRVGAWGRARALAQTSPRESARTAQYARSGRGGGQAGGQTSGRDSQEDRQNHPLSDRGADSAAGHRHVRCRRSHFYPARSLQRERGHQRRPGPLPRGAEGRGLHTPRVPRAPLPLETGLPARVNIGDEVSPLTNDTSIPVSTENSGSLQRHQFSSA